MEENQMRKSLTKFAKSGTTKQRLYRQELLQNPARNKDTRNSPLKDLDAPSNELEKAFARPKGTFDPKEEAEVENEVLDNIKKADMSKEKKNEYLYLLKKRMRTT
jgi:hypothetical protein